MYQSTCWPDLAFCHCNCDFMQGAVYRMTCCLSGTHAMTLCVEIIHCMCGLGPVFGVAECAVLTIFFPCWQGNRHSIAKFGVVYL